MVTLVNCLVEVKREQGYICSVCFFMQNIAYRLVFGTGICLLSNFYDLRISKASFIFSLFQELHYRQTLDWLVHRSRH